MRSASIAVALLALTVWPFVALAQDVSEAHLKRYLCEFDFRYTNREKVGINDVARTAIAVAGARGKRLTYETTRSGRAA